MAGIIFFIKYFYSKVYDFNVIFVRISAICPIFMRFNTGVIYKNCFLQIFIEKIWDGGFFMDRRKQEAKVFFIRPNKKLKR